MRDVQTGPAISLPIKATAALAGVALVCLLGYAQAPALEAHRPARASASNPPGDPERGRELAQTCLACHGIAETTSGSPPFHAPRLRHQRPSSIVYALQDYRSGRRKSDVMGPLAAALTDQQMRDVAAYLADRLTGVPDIQLAGSSAYALSIAKCSICHGETGMGEIEGTPVLAGQDASYLRHALEQYRNGGRKETTMRAVASALSADEIARVTSYYAAQPSLERVP